MRNLIDSKAVVKEIVRSHQSLQIYYLLFLMSYEQLISNVLGKRML